MADCFDLIAGAATGGILALGFARDDGNGKPKYAAKDLAGNVENLKAETNTLIQTHKAEMGTVCTLLQEGGGD